MNELGTPNNKAIYSRLGLVADKAHIELNKKYSNETANTEIKALMGQIKVSEVEIKSLNARIQADLHNRTYSASVKMRNVESKKFNDTVNGDH